MEGRITLVRTPWLLYFHKGTEGCTERKMLVVVCCARYFLPIKKQRVEAQANTPLWVFPYKCGLLRQH